MIQELQALFGWSSFQRNSLCILEWPKTHKKSVYLCFPSGGIKGVWHPQATELYKELSQENK